MRLTFVVHSTMFPSGGVLALYEFANGMSRRGHQVNLVHRPNLRMAGGWVRTVDDLSWAQFERGVTHHFEAAPPPDLDPGALDALPAEELARAIVQRWHGGKTPQNRRLPEADFVFTAGSGLTENAGLPLLFVQGDLVGSDTQRRRMHTPCPKVCVARWLVALGREEGVPDEQLVYVPCGIRHGKYRITRPLESRPRRVAMLYNSHPKKGTRFGLTALEEVAARVEGMTVVAFGARPPKEPLPRFVEYYRDPPQRVIVDEIYNGSRVFLQPSLREGFGLTSVEAMACGAALVTTANGGSDDFAFHDRSALVTPPRDATAMADAVEALLVDDERRLRIAREGAAVARTFDWDASAAKLEAFLQEYGADPGRFRRTPEAFRDAASEPA